MSNFAQPTLDFREGFRLGNGQSLGDGVVGLLQIGRSPAKVTQVAIDQRDTKHGSRYCLLDRRKLTGGDLGYKYGLDPRI